MEERLPLPSVSALGFVTRAAAWGTLLFGFLRLDWVHDNLLLPLALAQKEVACALFRAPTEGVVVDASCTGSDAMALCLAVTFAFPAPWRRRLVGCAVGLGLILAVNSVRIATLAATLGSPRLFETLHIYVWPAVLIVVAAGYLFVFMTRLAGSGSLAGSGAAGAPSSTMTAPIAGAAPAIEPIGAGSTAWSTPRFVGLTILLVAVYYSLFGRLLESDLVLAVAHRSAAVAGLIMAALGIQAQVDGGLLRTASAAFVVTPECVLTPVIPVYVAAVLAAPLSTTRRLLAVAATVPLFLGLGTARLLILALPATLIGSTIVGVHAFYQMIGALLAIVLVAWRGDGPVGLRVLRGLSLGGAVGVAVGWLDLRWLRPTSGEATAALHLGHGWVDSQGALAILPAFQLGLFVALLAAAGRTGSGRASDGLARAVSALLAFQVLFTIAIGELASHAGFEVPIVLIRLWSLALPLIAFWVVRRKTGSGTDDDARYLDFWNDVGDTFPDLGGAASTDYYLENEKLLFEEFLPELEGARVFKTDLWDEARNTRILRWAAGRGARTLGADISLPTTRRAMREFAAERLALGGAVGDVRSVPFRDGAFDAVYSMGTVEHFDETPQALEEIFRVTAPGGRAIIGVPNRHDPFLRPLLVAILYRLGLYGYGFEKSYSRRQLRAMCERAGFEVVAETGILFIPGWLRMLDLACWAWMRPLATLTGLAVRPFAWLYRTFPRLRRHGYLIAAVVTRPGGSTSTSRHASDASTKQ